MRKPSFLVTYSFLVARLKQLLALHLLAPQVASAPAAAPPAPQPVTTPASVVEQSQVQLVLTAHQLMDTMEGLWHIQPR
jgi:hypothetical protein